MAIYVTGDTHGGVDMHKLSGKALKKSGITLTPEDYLVILGDFGFPFLDKETDEQKGEYSYWMKWFSQKPYTILWVDGNHDNFNFWEKQPITQWHGGKVQIHPKAPNVIHLMRGEIYELDGRKIFAFGGAESHDKEYRVPDKTWWAQEICSPAECENAIRNLEKHGYSVDYVFTHTPPAHIINAVFNEACNDKTAMFLSSLVNLEYKVWCSGHIHKSIVSARDRFRSFYQDVMLIDDAEKWMNYPNR